jgi:hypothetical protein
LIYESKDDLSESQQLVEQLREGIAEAKIIEESHRLIEESDRLLDNAKSLLK